MLGFDSTDALVLLTGVLVVVTGFYAWQTKKTVDELRSARSSTVTPFVVLSLDLLGGLAGFVCIHNVGVGPAVDLDVTISWHPGSDSYRWKMPVLAPNQRFRFKGPGDRGFYFNELTEKFQIVRLSGICKDSTGLIHEVSYDLDIRDVWTTDVHLDSWWILDDRFDKKTVDLIEEISRSLKRIADAAQAPEMRRQVREFKTEHAAGRENESLENTPDD